MVDQYASTTESDYWTPRMSAKQAEVFNCYSRAVLLSGSRKGGKTIIIGHRIIKHMFETPGARVAIFSKTIKNATDGGIWDDLIKIIMPEWLDSGLDIEYTTYDKDGVPGPKTDPKTKTLFFKIKNKFGGESELKLFSLDHDKDVKQKVKGTRFSLIWFSELDLFEDKNVFKVSFLQLRMPHLTRDQHMWIADTNPSEDGPDCWIHKYWYQNRMKKWDTEKKNRHWAQFALFEFFLNDNPFITPDDIDELELLYEDDPDGYQRNVEGKWVKSGSGKGKFFSSLFSENVHVIGDSDNDAIELDPNTIELYTGWDLGSTNSSAHILEKLLINNRPVWIIHDELVIVGDQVSTEEFTIQFVAKMDAMEEKAGKKFIWRHWSDDSAMNAYRASSDCYDYQIVLAASGGKIELEGANKPEGSVQTRVKLTRQQLREQRLYVAFRCKATVAMFLECRRGSGKDYVERNDHKHPFDSFTYCTYMESLDDLLDLTSGRPNATSSNVKHQSLVAA